MKESKVLRRADEQLNADCDLIVQAHLKIRNPYNRNTEYDDISDQVRYTSSKPSVSLFRTMTETWSP